VSCPVAKARVRTGTACRGALVGRIEVTDPDKRRAVEGGTSEAEAEEPVEGRDAPEDAEHCLRDKNGTCRKRVRSPDAFGERQYRRDARYRIAGHIQFPGGGRLGSDGTSS
jgi:hypothetical protein